MPVELRRPKTILLPIDLSGPSASAAQCAKLVAERFGAAIVLLHVVEPPSYPTERLGEGMFDSRSRLEIARDTVREFGQRELPGLNPEVRIVEGDPARAIASAAEEIHADVVVMPTRGRGAFRRFLLGSTTAKVLNDVPVPVLTATHGHHAEQTCVPPDIGRILCAVALDDQAASVCRAAALVAAEYGASLTLVHALERPHAPDAAERESAASRLRQVADENHATGELVVEAGRPDEVVPRIARSMNADLVAIGRSSPGPLGRLRAQSYGIIRESPCPVLSV